MQTTSPVDATATHNTTHSESDTVGTLTNVPVPVKYNRKQRRGMAAAQARQVRADKAATSRRLANFHLLQDWKEQENFLTERQRDLVFKTVLTALFKKDFKNEREFNRKLDAVINGVVTGQILPGPELAN